MKFRSLFYSVFIFCFGCATIAHAQADLDSLRKVYADKAKHDTSRLKACYEIIWQGFLYSNPDSAVSMSKALYDEAGKKGLRNFQGLAVKTEGVAYLVKGQYDDAEKKFQLALKIFEETKDSLQIAKSLNNIGIVYNNRGELENAKEYYERSLVIMRRIGDKQGIATSLHTIGYIYQSQGDFIPALKKYVESLALKEEVNDKKGIANTLNNLGLLYKELNETKQALDYFKQSLKIREEIKDSYGIGVSLNNIADSYYKNNNLSTAEELSMRALRLQQTIGDKEGQGISLTLLGNIYRKKGDYPAAQENYLQSLEIRKEIGDNGGISNSQNNIAQNYLDQKEYKQAIEHAKKAMDGAEFIGLITELKEAANTLFKAYKATDKNKEALAMHEIYVRMKDSTESVQLKKDLAGQELKYEFRKEMIADSLAFAQQEQLKELEHNAQIERERNRQYILYGSLAFLLILGIMGFRSYQLKKKDNELLSKQKAEISDKNRKLETANTEINHKNKEITDSINYAQRLQLAILPSAEDFKKILPESFVFYNPKDIVSGDFYFLDQLGDHIFFAVADCTGHGVPGAFVSFVGHEALTHAIRDLELINPGKILDAVRLQVEHTFDKNEREEVKDGMDISLGVLNTKNGTLHFAGAHHTLYFLTSNITQTVSEKATLKNETAALIEIKGNRQGVGAGQGKEPFTTIKVNAKKGDMIYFSSDGYSDQFGGPQGKKFKTSQFKALLLELYDKPAHLQKEILIKAHYNWRGSLGQVDDVCVMGIQI